jgi:glutamyl-tRNA synthetase
MANIDVDGLADRLSVTDYKTVEPLLAELDKFLTLRTYLSGYQLEPAEKKAWVTLYANKVAIGIVRKGAFPNVSRWFNYIDAAHPEIMEEINKEAKAKRAAKGPKGANYEIGLKDTENGVVTRFPPEPS